MIDPIIIIIITPSSSADNELEVELDEFAVSYKPQKISPKFPGTVRDLLHKRIRDAYLHPGFQARPRPPGCRFACPLAVRNPLRRPRCCRWPRPVRHACKPPIASLAVPRHVPAPCAPTRLAPATPRP